MFIVSGVKPIHMHFFNRDLTFTFENYVKSQLHLQIVSDLYGRDIFVYKKALDYLRGKDQFLYECSLVLKYFYQDMANMLCNVLRTELDISPCIKIETSLGRESKIPKKQLVLQDIVAELKGVLENGDSTDGFSIGVFAQFNYEELERLEANDLLALASILLYFGNNSEETYIVEVV
jgi:hypothetical protein